MCFEELPIAGLNVAPAPSHQTRGTGAARGSGQALADSSICPSSPSIYQALGEHGWRDSEAGTKGIIENVD